MKKRGGRPTKLTPRVRRRLLRALLQANYYEAACASAGIAYETFRTWMDQGATDAAAGRSSEFSEFSVLVRRAEARAEARLVGVWDRAATRDWRAAAALLAARHRRRWGAKAVEVTGAEGGPISVSVLDRILAEAEAGDDLEKEG